MELFNLSTDLCMLVDWSMDIAVEMIIDSSTATYAIQQSTGSSSMQNGSHESLLNDIQVVTSTLALICITNRLLYVSYN